MAIHRLSTVAPDDPPSRIPRRIDQRPGIGIGAHIRQSRELRIVRLQVDHPALLLVRKGAKRLAGNGNVVKIGSGEAVAIPAGQTVDVTNQMGADGSYEAEWLIFDPSLLQDFALAHPEFPPRRESWALGDMEAGFLAAFEQARQALADPLGVPDGIARHRLLEVLLWVGLHGGRFVPETPTSLASRIRHRLSAALDQDWKAPEIASHLAMSEATLRRRLADEGVTLSELLVDTRMSFALTLLQSTDLPVTRIANDVGYESPSRFAVRFRQRFGFAPSDIRRQTLATEIRDSVSERSGTN